jgi:membrane protein DedA with SNARE-associated domain
MTFQSVVEGIIAFVQTNQQWAAPIVFMVALGESLAFLSLVLPGTAILAAASTMIGASHISFVPIWLAAGIGGTLGYSLSYWIGLYFKDSVPGLWPFKNNPELLVRGHAFFDKWGALGVFFGHFFGPVRAVIPVVAGMVAMRQIPFQLANVTSAFLWAFGVLAPGVFGVQWLKDWLG